MPSSVGLRSTAAEANFQFVVDYSGPVSSVEHRIGAAAAVVVLQRLGGKFEEPVSGKLRVYSLACVRLGRRRQEVWLLVRGGYSGFSLTTVAVVVASHLS
jgi:hypothetical protein